jgi:hypothetical protein
MRWIGVMALFALMAAFVRPVGAGVITETKLIGTRLIPTGSPVVPLSVELHSHPGRFPTDACVPFFNGDARAAKTVRIVFVYYDSAGNRSGEDALMRKGSFAGHTANVPDIHPLGRQPDCRHVPQQNLSTIAAYVDHVEFEDGSVWNASAMLISDHLDVSAAAAPDSSAPRLKSGSADPDDLPPLVVGAFNDCAAAQALKTAPTPLFAGISNVPLSADRNVIVEAQPGEPAGPGLFHPGAASVCRSSGDADRDAAAVDVVEHQAEILNKAEGFRVYFPVVATAKTCAEPPRLMVRQLVRPSFAMDERVAPPGQYDVLIRVTVQPDGLSEDAKVIKSVGRPPYEDAARRSALFSRYWPAVDHGVPVAGTFDFPMRWTIAAGKSSVFGPVVAGPAPGCETHAAAANN